MAPRHAWWLAIAIGLMLAGCSPGGGGGFVLDGDVRPVQDQDVPPGTYTIDSLEIPPGVTLSSDGTLVLIVAGDVDVQGGLVAGGRLELRVDGDLEVGGTLDGGGASATVGLDEAGPSDGALSGTTPVGDLPVGVAVVVAGDVSFASTARVHAVGPVVLTDDAGQLARSPDELNAEAETASGDDPTLMPLPPDDEAFEEPGPDPAPSLAPAQGDRTILLGGAIDVSDRPGDRPILLFWFDGAADLVLVDLSIVGPDGVTPDASDARDEPGEDAAGADGRRGMNLYVRNRGGKITVTGLTVFTLTDGGAGAAALVTCATATGGDGGQPGGFRMTASAGIDIQGTLRIVPGAGGAGGAAVATGTAGCDVTAAGGDGADVRRRLLVRGNVTGVDGIELGDQHGGAGGSANATGGNGLPGDPCEAGQDGGAAVATGGAGGDSTLVASAPVSVGDAIAGVGGGATAAGGAGGKGGDCPGGLGGAGGEGGPATATGGAAGDETEAASGGAAGATGGAGGAGGDTCGPPDGTGGAGGDGGAATATGGADSGGAKAASSGVGGAGGDGGDGATGGDGGGGGTGAGDPDALPDGAPGANGPVCAGPPPEEVFLSPDFADIPQGLIEPGAAFCLPVVAIEEPELDVSNVFAYVVFEYEMSTLGVEPTSIKQGNLVRFLGAITLALMLGPCNDPEITLATAQMLVTLAHVQTGGLVILSALTGLDFVQVATRSLAGLLSGTAPGDAGASVWRLANSQSSPDSGFFNDGVILVAKRDDLTQ